MEPDLDFLDQLANAAASQTLPLFRSKLDVDNKYKTGFDPVTEADRAAERAIRALINEHFPSHGILGEEYGAENTSAEFVWVIDPVDGTRAFISGLPVWGTLVGLYKNGRAVMGLMDQPFTRERYSASSQGAFYRHGDAQREPLVARSGVDLGEAILMTTSPALYGETDGSAYRRLENSVRLARYGCDCYAFAMVAGGYIDICIEPGLQSYDIAGLIAVIEQAGGVVTDWSGGRPEQGGNILACGSKSLHEQAMALIVG